MRMRAAAAAALLSIGLGPAAATVRIADDRGGQIGTYLAKYEAIKRTGEHLEIAGICASACTMLLGIIPSDRICVTSQAVLEFHTAWDFAPDGSTVASSAGNRVLWSYYPGKVRRWISRRGGLYQRILYLRGPELAAMYRRCNQ